MSRLLTRSERARHLVFAHLAVIYFVIKGRANLTTHIHKLMHIVMGQIGNQEDINETLKGVLKEKVQKDASDHDAHYIS